MSAGSPVVEAQGERGHQDEVVLRAVGIAKNYGVTRALKGVDFDVRAGSVTVLFGENGAGKSTLMKILAGIEQPSSGHLELEGEVVALASSTDAVERGISIIHQELNLCPNISVRDNIFLGRELRTRFGGIDYARQEEICREVLARLEEDIDPAQLAGDLPLGQQQVVEIARALSTDARILIMDEPTSALSVSEVEVLFRVIRELTAQGVAIVYISHHLEEAIDIADHAVVFRDGDLVATAEAHEIDLPWVVERMVGRSTGANLAVQQRHHGDVVLSIRHLDVVARDTTGRLAVRDLSLDVRAGEVVCLYGLMGAGRTELLEALAGRGPVVGGEVLLDGAALEGRSIRQRLSLGLGLVPEDRQADGLVQLMSVGQNLSLASIGSFTKRGLIASEVEREQIATTSVDMRVKSAGPQMPITSLSGGNQQKVVIGKVLMTGPKVLLLDEPTRGIDVGAKAEIFSLIFTKAAEGYAVLFATSEVSEALTASHRVVVLSKGRIAAEFDPATTTREHVMAASGEAVESTGHMGVNR